MTVPGIAPRSCHRTCRCIDGFSERKEDENGLYQCILGRRTDLCTCPDSYGENKNASGQDLGLLVCLGAVLGALQIYQPFIEFAGAGASVPLPGFGNTLWKGVKEAVDENGFIGILWRI